MTHIHILFFHPFSSDIPKFHLFDPEFQDLEDKERFATGSSWHLTSKPCLLRMCVIHLRTKSFCEAPTLHFHELRKHVNHFLGAPHTHTKRVPRLTLNPDDLARILSSTQPVYLAAAWQYESWISPSVVWHCTLCFAQFLKANLHTKPMW